MTTIAITGATGFLGRSLVASLVQNGRHAVRVLVREPSHWFQSTSGVKVFTGDLNKPESLNDFLTPDSTVVNLVYLWNAGQVANLQVAENLAQACRRAHVARVIHISTAAVVGRTRDGRVTESTMCRPTSAYGITKLKVESTFREAAGSHFDLAIVRPTSIFGPEGAPLERLICDLLAVRPLRNYLKSCIFGRRAMNLVYIGNVIAALRFLIDYGPALNGETFIVSDDATAANNFRDVEKYLMEAFGASGYPLEPLALPSWVLMAALYVLRRNNVNPMCRFRQDKLESLGFRSPITLEKGLAEYADWYRRSDVASFVANE